MTGRGCQDGRNVTLRLAIFSAISCQVPLEHSVEENIHNQFNSIHHAAHLLNRRSLLHTVKIL